MIRRRGAAPSRALHGLTAAMALAFGLGACASGDEGAGGAPRRSGARGEIVVFAASSLAEAVDELASSFERRHDGVEVRVNLAGSAQLVTQLDQGAEADVLVTADEITYDRAVRLGLAEEPLVIARNRLEIVVEPGNPKGITGTADLGRDDVVVVTCAPTVPCGAYAERAFAIAQVAVDVRAREENVKAVVSRVALGEADAGIVYATDVRAAGTSVEGIAMAEADDPSLDVRYAAGVLSAAGNRSAAQRFVAFLASADAAVVLARLGFMAPARR